MLIVVLLPREALKTRVGEQIAAWTGRDVSLRGEPELDFFPELTVTLRDVQVGGPPGMADAEIVSMDSLEGTIRLLPLVIGRVEIGSFTMVRPLIRLVRDDRGSATGNSIPARPPCSSPLPATCRSASSSSRTAR